MTDRSRDMIDSDRSFIRMRSKKQAAPSDTELLELTKWHIARCDGLRQALSSRAAVILSGDALIAAGIAAFLSQILNAAGRGEYSSSALIAVEAGLVLSIAATFMSVLHAMLSLDNRYAWRPQSQSRRSPDSPAFNHGDTLRIYRSFADFREAQMSFSYPDILNHAQVELWFVLRSHRYRYIQLRKSTRFLSVAAAALLTVICILLVSDLASLA
jgi:hypothetical protein